MQPLDASFLESRVLTLNQLTAIGINQYFFPLTGHFYELHAPLHGMSSSFTLLRQILVQMLPHSIKLT